MVGCFDLLLYSSEYSQEKIEYFSKLTIIKKKKIFVIKANRPTAAADTNQDTRLSSTNLVNQNRVSSQVILDFSSLGSKQIFLSLISNLKRRLKARL